MIEKLITLFKIGRAFAKSDALSYFEEIYDPPWIVKLLVKISLINLLGTPILL